MLKRIVLFTGLGIAAFAGLVIAVVYYESRATPDVSGEYVALGSSFAAGPKLGPLAPDSPHACWRTVENYPHQLARAIGLRLVDVSCGGAKTKNLLEGGPFFQPPQIDAVGPSAHLVTITVGGNDVDYIGDLGLLAYRARRGVLGRLVRTAWQGPAPVDARPFDELSARLVEVVEAVRLRAPQASIVLVTYPRVLPARGTCTGIEISAQDAALMRDVAARLVQATRAAAARTGALLVDMDSLSAGHDACSVDPWVHGSAPKHGAMFHPSRSGARATALAVQEKIRDLGSHARIVAPTDASAMR